MNNTLSEELQQIFAEMEAAGLNPRLCDTPVPYYDTSVVAELPNHGHLPVAIHSSCIVYKNKAYLFLGESGTGKSTHTRLWRENIEGAVLLNDDSPMIRVEEGKVWAYGSPWSGKTPCYKQERYELAGCVRLSQAPYNKIKKLSVLQAYGAIHPSCPPEFAYDSLLYDGVSGFIGKMLSQVPFYHLVCLPDADAARLSCTTITGETL